LLSKLGLLFILAFLDARIHPLSCELRQGGAFDGRSGEKLELKWLKLDIPLSDTACGIGVAQDFFQGVRGDHLDGMALEVVAQLPAGDEEGVEELLLHRVALMCITHHHTDEVDVALHEARDLGGWCRFLLKLG
jgi:hypothetical protein